MRNRYIFLSLFLAGLGIGFAIGESVAFLTIAKSLSYIIGSDLGQKAAKFLATQIVK